MSWVELLSSKWITQPKSRSNRNNTSYNVYQQMSMHVMSLSFTQRSYNLVIFLKPPLTKLNDDWMKLESRFNQKAMMSCSVGFCCFWWKFFFFVSPPPPRCKIETISVITEYSHRADCWGISTGSDYSLDSLGFQLFVQVLGAVPDCVRWRCISSPVFLFLFLKYTHGPSPHSFFRCLEWLFQFPAILSKTKKKKVFARLL